MSLYKTILRFISPFWTYKTTFLLSFIKELSFAVMPLVHIRFIQQLVMQIELGDQQRFFEIIKIYAGIIITYELFSFLSRRRGWVITICTYRKKIQNDMLTKFVGLDNTTTNSLGTGKILSILEKGTDLRAIELFKVTKYTVVIFTTFLYAFVSIWKMEPIYAIVFLIVYILIYIVGLKINSYSLHYRKQRYEHRNSYVSYLVKIIMSKYEIVQSGKIKEEIAGLNVWNENMLQVNKIMANPIHRFFAIPENFVTISQVIIIVIVGSSIFLGTATLADLVGIFGVFTLLSSVINVSMEYLKDFTNNFTKIEGMRDFIDNTPVMSGLDTGDDFEYKIGDIELKSVSFSYNDSKNIFSSFDLSIRGSQKTAFVGPSGGGKSTLIKLIAGYIEPTAGSIFVDNQDITMCSKSSFYTHVGYLTQEPNVFDGSIIDNLLFGIPDGSNDQQTDHNLKEAIRLSKSDFIYDLPDGLQTEIGERGVRLSGGQRQRLAIAKVFLKNPEIVILDEPTSALDSESEEAITEAMEMLFKGRTVIIIAHRLQTVKNADEIVMIDSGEVVERGTHQQLMNQGGKYWKLVELQSGF